MFSYVMETELKNNLLIFFFKFIERMETKSNK
jgi:hypothetical protein